MNIPDILNAWAAYSEYDPDQKRFNLLSSNYYMHNASKSAAAISDYDPTGSLAVLYLKEMFRRMCKESSFNMMALMEHPEGLDEHKKMWDMFHSPEVKSIEDSILGAMDGIIQKIVPVKQIGERDPDAERAALAESITGVVEELGKCNVELFMRGGNFGDIKSFSTEIHVFDTLSQCLLALEPAPDSMYICYIRNRNTSDGYFGFFVKTNGNILSVNERINEMYPGQHIGARNGRWSESKAYQIFPYNLMKDIGERDYLGYAHSYTLDDSNLKLFELGPNGYIPLVLSMVMISVKYSNMPTENYPLSYVDALLPHNLELAEKSEETDRMLIVPENSALVAAHKGYVNDLTTDAVLTGSARYQFDHLLLKEAGIQKSYRSTGTFPTGKNIFIELYGDGFELNKDALLEKDRHLRLPDSVDKLRKDDQPFFEFVGDKDRLDLIAYTAARRQLAEYIRDRMYEEYVTFGGITAVRKWFEEQINIHREDILRLCVQAFDEAVANGEKLSDTNKWSSFCKIRSSGFRIGIEECKAGMDRYGYNRPFNKCVVGNGKKLACAYDNVTKATYDFNLVFTNWYQMAALFGEENIPKIVKGYVRDGHDSAGNSNLDCVDYADGIGTPFEEREYCRNPRYWSKSKWHDHFFRNHEAYKDWMTREAPDGAPEKASTMDFFVYVSLSKRGINKARKELL